MIEMVKMEDTQSQSDESEFDFSLPCNESFQEEEKAEINMISEKSVDKYNHSYNAFLQWRKDNNYEETFTEQMFMDFFVEKSKMWKPSTLWSQYSMLRCTINLRHNINISAFKKVRDFLKNASKGYKCQKAKIFSLEDVKKFVTKAPDYDYLASKVILIFGVSGACKNNELPSIRVKDVESHGNIYLVKIATSKTAFRSFTITEEFAKFVRKYEGLRPTSAMTERFFLNYHRGKCTVQVIGVNTFAKIPQRIAQYLSLPNPELYTGHSFRSSSASILTDVGANMTFHKRVESTSKNVAEKRSVEQLMIKQESMYDDDNSCDNVFDEDSQGKEIELRNLSNREIKLPKRGVTIKMINCVNCTVQFEK